MFATLFETQSATNWLTLVLVVITGLYCFYTYKIVQKNGEMVTQMKAQYESFIAPVITVSVHIKYGTMLCLKVRNAGQSAAKSFRLGLDRDFYQFAEFNEEKNLRSFHIFRETVPSFAPGEQFFLFMSQGFNLGKSHADKLLTPYEFNLEAEYEFGGRTVKQRHEVNLRAYLHTQQDRDEMLEEVEKIRKAIEKK